MSISIWDEPEERKEETHVPPANQGIKTESGGKLKPEPKAQKFKISDPMINEFITWVRTLDPNQYPLQAQQIRQNIGKNYRPSHLGNVIQLFRMWLAGKSA